MERSVAILFANLKGNIGDYAILDAMLRHISCVYPEHQIDVYPHSFLDIDENRLEAFRSADAPEFTISGKTFYLKVPAYLKRAYRFGVWPWIQHHLINNLCSNALPEAARFADYDAIFIAGGDQWNGMDLGISMFATLKAISHYNKNIYSYPFSLNTRILNFNSISDLQNYYSYIRNPLIVRDGISHDLLSKMGIPSVLGQDIVFSLQNIGISIEPKYDKNPERILLVLTGGHSRELLEKSLSQLIEKLLPHKRPIELLTTCAPEDEQVLNSLSNRYGVVTCAPTTWQDTVSELKQSSLIVTDRLHCLILSTFAETPVFPVSDRQKSEAFVQDAGITHYAKTMDEVSPEAIELAIADRKRIITAMRLYRNAALNNPLFPISTQPK